jgi:hypothetical protein
MPNSWQISMFFLPQGSCCLNLNSWIQLDAYYEFDAALLERKVVDGKVYKIGTLDAHIRHLLICAINSEDISSSQEKLLQAALAALPKNATGPGGI